MSVLFCPALAQLHLCVICEHAQNAHNVYDHILAYQMRPINTFFYLMCYIPDNEFIWAYIEMWFRSLHSQYTHLYNRLFRVCCVSLFFSPFLFVLNNENNELQANLQSKSNDYGTVDVFFRVSLSVVFATDKNVRTQNWQQPRWRELKQKKKTNAAKNFTI